LFLLVQVSYHK